MSGATGTVLRSLLWLLLGGWVGSWALFGTVIAPTAFRVLRVALPLLLAVACLYSQFGVSGEISEIRDQAFGPGGNEALAARWNTLHQLSLGIYLAVSGAILWLLVLHAASDSQPEKGEGGGDSSGGRR